MAKSRFKDSVATSKQQIISCFSLPCHLQCCLLLCSTTFLLLFFQSVFVRTHNLCIPLNGRCVSDAADMPEAIQRDLHKLEKWVVPAANHC